MSKPLGQRVVEHDSHISPSAEQEAHAGDMIADLQRVQIEHEGRFITRDFYLSEGNYSRRQISSRFGTFQEFRRAADLDINRGAGRIEKAIAMHSARDRYRGFYELEIQPWVGKYERNHAPGMKTLLIGSDFHDKEADSFTLSVFLDTANRVQPDVIVLAGDIFDAYEFSRFNQDPRQLSLKERFEYVKQHILAPLRENCPNAQIDFIIGNHEARLLRHFADRSPFLMPLLDLMGVTLNQVFGLEEYQVNLISKGDFSAYQPKEHREEVRKNYKVYFDTLVVGHKPADYGMCSVSAHTHKPKFESKVNALSGAYFNLTLGCIAGIDAEYVQGLNRYQNGFALVHIDPELREAVPEPVVFSDHYAMVGGILYKRT